MLFGSIKLCYLCSSLARTEPGDVARVEKQTYVCTEKKEDAVPTPKEGVESKLGNWKSPSDMDAELEHKFPGCMRGKVIHILTGLGAVTLSGPVLVAVVCWFNRLSVMPFQYHFTKNMLCFGKL